MAPRCSGAAATAGAYGSWQLKVQLDGAEKLFSNPVDLAVFWKAVAGQDSGYRGKSLEAFFRALLEGRQDIGVPGYVGLSFSWLALLLGFLVIAILLTLVYRMRGRDMRRFNSTLTVLFVSCALFAVGLAASYLFQFTEKEALGLASFDRYMNIPRAMVAIVLFLLTANLGSEPGRTGTRVCVAMLVVVLALAPLKELASFALRRNEAYSESVRAPYETTVRRVPELVDEPTAKISVVSIGSRDFDLQLLAFCLRPLRAADYAADTLALTEDDVCSVSLTPADWIAALERDGFDYVLLFRLNERLRPISPPRLPSRLPFLKADCTA